MVFRDIFSEGYSCDIDLTNQRFSHSRGKQAFARLRAFGKNARWRLAAGTTALQTSRGLISRAVVKHEVDRFVAYASGVRRTERRRPSTLGTVAAASGSVAAAPAILSSRLAQFYTRLCILDEKPVDGYHQRSLARSLAYSLSRRCIGRSRDELLPSIP